MNYGDSNADGGGAARTRLTIQREYTTMSATRLRAWFTLRLNNAATQCPQRQAIELSARTVGTTKCTMITRWMFCSTEHVAIGLFGIEGGTNEKNRQAGGAGSGD